MTPTTITIGEVRFSYTNVFQPQPPFPGQLRGVAVHAGEV